MFCKIWQWGNDWCLASLKELGGGTGTTSFPLWTTGNHLNLKFRISRINPPNMQGLILGWSWFYQMLCFKGREPSEVYGYSGCLVYFRWSKCIKFLELWTIFLSTLVLTTTGHTHTHHSIHIQHLYTCSGQQSEIFIFSQITLRSKPCVSADLCCTSCHCFPQWGIALI